MSEIAELIYVAKGTAVMFAGFFGLMICGCMSLNFIYQECRRIADALEGMRRDNEDRQP